MNYYLDVKLDKDHTIYSFSVDKDEFDWYQLNGGVEFNVWESMLGFEYAKVKEVEY